MTEYIDKTEAMRRFKPFGREIPKEQVMAVLARIDEGIVRCKDCRHANECHKSVQYTRNGPNTVTIGYSPIEWCSRGERREK